MNSSVVSSERAFDLAHVCMTQEVDPETLRTLSAEGIIELYSDPNGREWLAESSVERVQVYQRLRKTLDVNHEGAGFAILLLAELKELRARLHMMESSPVQHDGKTERAS